MHFLPVNARHMPQSSTVGFEVAVTRSLPLKSMLGIKLEHSPAYGGNVTASGFGTHFPAPGEDICPRGQARQELQLVNPFKGFQRLSKPFKAFRSLRTCDLRVI